MADGFKCGFVAILGPTNSGKSTLTNALVGEKVSIVSPKPQTTYHAIRGVRSTSTSQMIFTDTPGFQNYPDRMPRLLNRVALERSAECEVFLWVFDVSEKTLMAKIRKLSDKIRTLGEGKVSLLILNKVDRIAKPTLLPLLQEIQALGLFQQIIPISALKNDGVERILSLIETAIPEGQALFPTDAQTDRSMSFRITEIIREKVYRATREELPYTVYVEMEEWGAIEEKSRVPTYRAILHVDSPSRKKILIGKRGEVLKKVGTMAREDIEKILKKHICLKLHVDVEPGWRENANKVDRYLELS